MRTTLRLGAPLVLLTTLAACSAGAKAPAVVDAWAKAADGGATAVFGTVTNPGDEPLRLVGARSAAAARVELHTTATGSDGSATMHAVPSLEVPAHGTLALGPGGDHLMLLDLVDPLEPGEEVTVVLELEDGSTLELLAPVKEYAGAQEDYDEVEHAAPGHDHPERAEAEHEGHP